MWTIFNLRQKVKNYFQISRRMPFEKFSDIKPYADKLPDIDADKFKTKIKFWLPTLIADCLRADCDERFKGKKTAFVVRHFLTQHCYGRAALQLMTGERTSFDPFHRYSGENNSLFEALECISSIEEVAEQNEFILGKNIHAYCISCSTQLKADLTVLAELRGLTLSEYIRKIMITYYLGNGFMPTIDVISDDDELDQKERMLVQEFLAEE